LIIDESQSSGFSLLIKKSTDSSRLENQIYFTLKKKKSMINFILFISEFTLFKSTRTKNKSM
jgi:hypothetical protein